MSKKQIQIQQKLNNFLKSIKINQLQSYNNNLYELIQLSNKSQKHDNNHIHLYDKITSINSIQKIDRYHELKKQKRKNQEIIMIVQKGKIITNNIKQLINYKQNKIQIFYQFFNQIIQSIQSFEELGSKLQSQIDFNKLRQEFLKQTLIKVNKTIQISDLYSSEFKKIKENNNFPIKKDQIRKDPLSEKDRLFIIFSLYRQACFIAIKKYLLSLLEIEEKCADESILSFYWDELIKTVSYLFVNHSELRNLQQPSWMFEYLQQCLSVNYRYFIEFICKKDLKNEIYTNITRYFLTTAYRIFISHIIKLRFEEDISNLNEFLLFNFIDQLGNFEVKLASSFGIKPTLVEQLLIRFDGSHQILAKVLQYEQKWFESKIFEDFVNIDYSRVNLKNLDASNIVSNFLSLFERLYQKFTNITDSYLHSKITKFYQRQILNLIAHIKTSFDRIYSHSNLPKIDVLLGFKRIQNQLRSSLKQFLLLQPRLEQNLQKQYYQFLLQYFQVCSLEAITPTHKKLHISLNQIMDYLYHTEENEHEKYIKAFTKIFQEWEARMEQILKFAPYTDKKIRSIFFKYLQATKFSSVGLNLYLKIFEPYLRFLFSEDRHRTLISMITMNRQSFNDYIETHVSTLAFLTGQEMKQLYSFKKAISFD